MKNKQIMLRHFKGKYNRELEVKTKSLVPMIKTELIINKIGAIYQKYMDFYDVNDGSTELK